MQNWIAGAEFADSAGADIISSSLGYSNGFTDPAFDIPYAQRDGNTMMITIAADLAAKKGMLVVNSAGNNGNLNNDFKFVSCPADGDSVLTVGATDVNGAIANFSSWGPNGAGKLKPNIVSVGQATVFANAAGNPVSGNGTSFAAPNVCGLIACLWQAFPEFTNMEIIDAVQKSADKYNTPDNRFGYGLPDFRKAYEALLKEQEKRNADRLAEGWIKSFPVPFNGIPRITFKAPITGRAFVSITNAMGIPLANKTLDITADQPYTIEFANLPHLSKGVYYIRYNDGKNKQTVTLLKR
jgi:subtilisin family serine protease